MITIVSEGTQTTNVRAMQAMPAPLPNVTRYVAIRPDGEESEHRTANAARRKAGVRGRIEERRYYTTGVAAEVVGVSARKFRALMEAREIVPASTYHSRAHEKVQWRALWSVEQVQAAIGLA